jgi:hypothetical protein
MKLNNKQHVDYQQVDQQGSKMSYITTRKNLINHKQTLSIATLKEVTISELCDESLHSYFDVCMNRRLYAQALDAALLLDALVLPRRGKIIDESGGYLTQRAARISQARTF